ncbi:MAG: hypothetical protein H5T96_09010 [Tissierellales bacterium]|nr:hypothetical protein [Tissierellales bacterium]
MKLELFDFIDKTLELIESDAEKLNNVAEELENFFNNSLFIKDHFLNVNYRIKSSESLKEKILRHNFYLKYSTPQELIENLSDLIGFRIECRFLEDEKKIYQDITTLFNIERENGYYTNPLNESIYLKLKDKQPQIQKNGFEIYKIDGKYIKEDISVNFELQIKSMVNIFWSDIEHKVLYKNYNYMIIEDFFRDIMSSIKDNLSMIDRQLMLIYNHLDIMNASDEISKKSQLKALLSKMIHDVYSINIRNEVGVIIELKKSTDIIVDFLFMKAENDKGEYTDEFLKILNRLNEIGEAEIDFATYLDFEREITYSDDFLYKFGNKILEIINKDFRWFVFFKMIFDIENGSNCEDFEEFLKYLELNYIELVNTAMEGMKLEDDEKEIITYELLNVIADVFCKNPSIDFINNCTLDKLLQRIRDLLGPINNFNSWVESKNRILSDIYNYDNYFYSY